MKVTGPLDYLLPPTGLGDATVESLIFSINPDTGTDPTSTRKMSHQTQVTLHGKFATAKGVFSVLPREIRHPVDLVYDDGYFIIDFDHFEGLERLELVTWEPYTDGSYTFFDGDWDAYREGSILIKSVSETVVPAGTSALGIASSTGGYSLTLDSDPGFTADAYQGMWLSASSGAGDEADKGFVQTKSIRSHNGTNFEVAGRFSGIDGTTEVEIRDAATTLVYEYNNFSHMQINAKGGTVVGIMAYLCFQGINILTNDYVSFNNCFVLFRNTKIQGTVFMNNTRCELNTLVVDAFGRTYGLAIWPGSYVRGGTSESAWLVRNQGDPNYAGVVVAGGSGGTVGVYLYKGSIDDCAGSAIKYLGTGYSANHYSNLTSSGIAKYGVDLSTTGYTGGHLRIDISYSLSGLHPTGALGDILLNGEVVNYTDLSVVGDVIEGSAGTMLISY